MFLAHRSAPSVGVGRREGRGRPSNRERDGAHMATHQIDDRVSLERDRVAHIARIAMLEEEVDVSDARLEVNKDLARSSSPRSTGETSEPSRSCWPMTSCGTWPSPVKGRRSSGRSSPTSCEGSVCRSRSCAGQAGNPRLLHAALRRRCRRAVPLPPSLGQRHGRRRSCRVRGRE
jgi:hypothetical protein